MDYELIPQFILNYIFVSVPQNMLIVLAVVFLIKEYEYFKKENFKQTLIAVLAIAALPSALFMNYTHFFTELTSLPRIGLNFILYIVFILHFMKHTIKDELWDEYIKSDISMNEGETQYRSETERYIFVVCNDKPSIKYKRFKSIVIGHTMVTFLLYAIEISTILFLQLVLNFDVDNLANSTMISILCFLGEFIIFSVALYIGYSYVNKKDILIFKVWKKDKIFRISIVTQITVFFVVALAIYNFVLKNNVFYSFSSQTTFTVIIGLIFFIAVQILIPYFMVKRYKD